MYKRTLLFLVTEDWYFVSHRLPLAHAALAAGYRVVVATRVQQHGKVIEDSGCELIALRLRRSGRNPFTELLALIQIVGIYRRIRPAIVHHVALKAVLYGSIAARLARIPVVINAVAGMGYTFSSTDTLAQLIRPLMRVVLRTFLGGKRSWVILQNPDDLRLLLDAKAVDPTHVEVMRGAGVDLGEFRPSTPPSGLPTVLLATRLIWDKGVGEFVEAARLLRGRGTHARFVLVGAPDPGNPSAVPEGQLAAWHAEGVIEWWGQRADMAEVLWQTNVFCFPSACGEGIPKVLLEAAAAGLPIVTTDAPGCREVVREGDNGLLVSIRDAAAVADAVEKLLHAPELRARMGARSREIAVSEFGIERVVTATLALYRRLASPEPRLIILVTGDGFLLSHWRPLVRFALERGYEVTVATKLSRPRSELEALGVRVEPIAWERGGRNPVAELRSLWAIVARYRRVRPDVCHHVAIKPVLYGSVAARFAGRPAVVNALSGLGYVFLGRGFEAGLLRIAATTALRLVADGPRTVMLFENPDDELLFRSYRIVRTGVTAQIPGAGVSIERYYPAAPQSDPPTVILLSGMLWDKGVGEFEAVASACIRLLQDGASRGIRARQRIVDEFDVERCITHTMAILHV